jgi:hypothetical protein
MSTEISIPTFSNPIENTPVIAVVPVAKTSKIPKPTTPLCVQKTSKGKDCKRHAREGGTLCGIHQNQIDKANGVGPFVKPSETKTNLNNLLEVNVNITKSIVEFYLKESLLKDLDIKYVIGLVFFMINKQPELTVNDPNLVNMILQTYKSNQ